ncbi:MAG: T9SS type A sorting domain-containing protein [Candidatus Kapabacteria bacterium]|nr:T9SS type A sorting domain-containing protein [Candidatus Kapabacteria bacterium]
MKVIHLIVILILIQFDLFSQNNIIFSEDFEIANKQELTKKWKETSNLARMNLSSEKPPSSLGSKSLMMVFNADRPIVSHLFKSFDKGYNQLFARFYCKFSNNHSAISQFVKLGCYNPLSEYSQLDFNILPNGSDRFSGGPIVRSDFSSWDLSANWMGMKVNPDSGVLSNQFKSNPAIAANTNKWYCIEFMLKINDPVSSSNGELALWIDGRKVMHLGQGFPNGYWENHNFFPSTDNSAFEGFQWRADDNMKINYFWFLYYIKNASPGKTDTMWVDDIVLSTNYIGPIGGSNIYEDKKESEITVNYNHRTNSLSIIGLDNEELIQELKLFNLLGQNILNLSYSKEILTSNSELLFNQISLEKGLYFVYVKTSKKEFYSKLFNNPY